MAEAASSAVRASAAGAASGRRFGSSETRPPARSTCCAVASIAVGHRSAETERRAAHVQPVDARPQRAGLRAVDLDGGRIRHGEPEVAAAAAVVGDEGHRGPPRRDDAQAVEQHAVAAHPRPRAPRRRRPRRPPRPAPLVAEARRDGGEDRRRPARERARPLARGGDLAVGRLPPELDERFADGQDHAPGYGTRPLASAGTR